MGIVSTYVILKIPKLRLSDSVVLAGNEGAEDIDGRGSRPCPPHRHRSCGVRLPMAEPTEM